MQSWTRYLKIIWINKYLKNKAKDTWIFKLLTDKIKENISIKFFNNMLSCYFVESSHFCDEDAWFSHKCFPFKQLFEVEVCTVFCFNLVVK